MADSPATIAPLLNRRDIQRILNCSETTVFRYIKAGKLRGVYIGGQLKFPQDEVERFIAEGAARFDVKHPPQQPDAAA